MTANIANMITVCGHIGSKIDTLPAGWRCVTRSAESQLMPCSPFDVMDVCVYLEPSAPVLAVDRLSLLPLPGTASSALPDRVRLVNQITD